MVLIYSTDSSRGLSRQKCSSRKWQDSPTSIEKFVPSPNLLSSPPLKDIWARPRMKNRWKVLERRMVGTSKYPLGPIFLKTLCDLCSSMSIGKGSLLQRLPGGKKCLLAHSEMVYLRKITKYKNNADMGHSTILEPVGFLCLRPCSERTPSRLLIQRRISSSTLWHYWETPLLNSCPASP